MSKFTIGVIDGIAAVYPNGTGAKDLVKVLSAGESIKCEVGEPHPEQQMARTFRDEAKDDVAAPAAGVATDKPVGARDGTLEVVAVEGGVTVRIYAGSAFTEERLDEGESVGVPVTESNKITLAVYAAAVTKATIAAKETPDKLR